jgi:fused signal recognition particle receptor
MAKFGFAKKLGQLFGLYKNKNEDFFDDLTDTLIEGDIGAKTAFEITEKLEKLCKEKKLTEEADIKAELKNLLMCHIKTCDFEIEKDKVSIYMLLGVNGAGKTTTAAKLSKVY